MYRVNENDRQKAHELIQSLYGNKKKDVSSTGKTRGAKRTEYLHKSGITVSSWKIKEGDYKKSHVLTMARGLFTRKAEDERYEIVIRGYNKFFNVGEMKTWKDLMSHTESPYELTVKENGCVIFIGGLPGGHLIVTSKHSTGERQGVISHAVKGTEWVERHLASTKKSPNDLANFLYKNKLTAVAELCDDSFEEHVLPYPSEISGLYLHGMNYNVIDLKTWPSEKVQEFAREWGFIPTQYIMKKSIDEVKEFTDKIGKNGHYDGRAVEGFVIRTKDRSTGECFFFKVKYDEPYFMYREWREVTKTILNKKKPKSKYALTQKYINWVTEKLRTEPGLFEGYKMNHGIIKIREMFLNDQKMPGETLISTKVDKEFKKTLIITIASIGCGKTSLSLALSKLFGFEHTQKDDMTSRVDFYKNIGDLLETHYVVIADWDNLTLKLRKTLIEAVKSRHQNLFIVGLYWYHDINNLEEVYKITSKRVFERGEHHQSCIPDIPEYERLMWSFLRSFEPLDSNHGIDGQFNLVIELKIANDLKDNLKIAIEQLKTILEMREPSKEEIVKAIEEATHYEPTVHKIIEKRSPEKSNRYKDTLPSPDPYKNNPTPSLSPKKTNKPRNKPPVYYGVKLVNFDMENFLADFFRENPNVDSGTFHKLQQNNRIKIDGHVTLIHRNLLKNNPSEEIKEMWEQCKNLSDLKTQVKLYIDKLIFDGEKMALVVKGIEPFIKSINEIPHITVGTIDSSVKPIGANTMCESALRDKSSHKDIKVIEFISELEIDGIVNAFYS
nr:4063_t:CDS:2 [Entrophospora candida]